MTHYCFECRHRAGSWLWWYDRCLKSGDIIRLRRGGENRPACDGWEEKKKK